MVTATGCTGTGAGAGAAATIGRGAETGTGGGGGGATGCGAGAAVAGRLIRTTGVGAGEGAIDSVDGAACDDGGTAAGRLTRTAGVGDGAGAAGVGALTLIRGGAGGDGAGGAALAIFGGGGAISVTGAVRVGADAVGETDNATGPLKFPNCRFTSSLIRADKSAPHSGQANVTGLRTISGDASKAYLPPQSHWIFIRYQGFGFNSTTFVPRGNAMDDADGDDFMPPSQNKNVPPYL